MFSRPIQQSVLRARQATLEAASDGMAYVAALERATREGLDSTLRDTEVEVDRRVARIEALSSLETSFASLPWADPAWADFVPDSGRRHGLATTYVGRLERELVLAHGAKRTVDLPALLPIIGRGGLMLQGAPAEMKRLRKLLVATALRLFATAPAGLVRATLIDPVEFGQSFAELLSLDPWLIGPMAWQEKRQIEEALLDITAGMSQVIQRRLKNKYANIEAYNADAKSVPEPYRLLLVANFPAGFDEGTAQRLLGIARSGPRVGVHVLMTWDLERALPHKFSAQDLESTSTVVEANSKGIRICHPVLSNLTFRPDPLPDRSTLDTVVEVLNRTVKSAKTIEVGFTDVAEEGLWTRSTTEDVWVPIGLAGSERHDLAFGRAGTNHHALIGGATGSGKSVLLHSIITGLALGYAPDELQLYLIDFKEGVELADYRNLPHVRVLAIESEREFGLSTLRGLQRTIEKRGESFRDAGVGDLTAYRKATGQPCPRIVAVVDECQRFFERKDAVANEARTLLDFLVREGRGFGVHVILASQSLPTGELEIGTLSQIGVRVALRMSEADSYKILSKNNDAARTLDRPGKAIFNDHGGEDGGNTEIQIYFITPAERRAHLERIVAHAKERKIEARPLVFEGNRPASAWANRTLVGLLGGQAPGALRSIPLFVGEPTRIQSEHTAFKMRRQARSHLLLCGQDEASALAVTSATVSSFLAHRRDAADRVFVLDLSNVDSPVNGRLAAFAAEPRVSVRSRRQTVRVLEEVEAELSRRAAAEDAGREPPTSLVVLCIFGVQGARDLQPDGARKSAAAQTLSKILFEGPDLGIHVVAWVNLYERITDALDARTLKEIDGRIALRGGGSERLLGAGFSTSGFQIKQHYGYLHDAGTGEPPEKFRVYGAELMEWYEQRAARGRGLST